MTLQGSGAISFANIQTEFGGSNPIGINEYYRNGANVTGNNTSVPTSGTIDMADFYGTSLLQPYETTDLFGDGSGRTLFRLNNTFAESQGLGNSMAGFGAGSSPVFTTNTPSNKISHSFSHQTGRQSIRTTNCRSNNDTTFTLSFWLKCSFHGSADFAIASFAGSSIQNLIGKFNHGARFGVFPRNTSGGAGFRQMSSGGSSTILNNTWQHFMLTSNNSASSTKMYIDNVSQSMSTLQGYTTGPQTKSQLRIGIRNDSNTSQRRNFLICQVRVFNKVLSSSERSTVYNELL